jgi:hypothetical protein
MRLPVALLLSTFLPSVAAASTSSNLNPRDTCAARLTTCASGQIHYLRTGDGTAPVLALNSPEARLTSNATLGFRFQPLPGQLLGGTPGNPMILAVYNDGRQWPRECDFIGRDECRKDATTTPEPVTMTLLATGLIGMAGANRLRRRKKPLDA